MMKILLALLFIITLFVSSPAQQQQSVPRFEDYAATVYKGKRAPVNVKSSGLARNFRTMLRDGAKEGVNFAGHYTLASWGCGTACMQVAIIDAKTGTVYFPEQIFTFSVWYWGDNDDALQFKPNSRLLMMSGFPPNEANGEEPKSGLHYYEWTGERLKLVKLIEKSRE
ncbi:MAG: hypothetical protein WBP93_18595 [Pyrinomonadaceae bacterium]